MTNTLNERELIQRAKAYDETALQQIYEQFAPAIFRYIYYRVGDYDVAEDLRADVFMKMLEGLPSFEYQGWSISAWLYRIAHARVVDHLRRSSRRKHEPLSPLHEDPQESLETLTLNQLDHVALRKALMQLTDEQSHVIILRFIEERSLRETAEVMGRTEGAIKALQHRALNTLGRLLQLATD